MFGGALADLDKIDKSKKTIILMGEWHTHITDSTYMEILSKQKRLIDIVKEKYDRAAMFYSEAPKETATHVMSPSIHSTETIRYVLHIGMALQLSSVARCDRELFGSCDEGYANDIIAAISDPEIHCVLVQIGLDHVPVLKHILETRMEDVQVVVVNTVSTHRLSSVMSQLSPSTLDLIQTEPPYMLPTQKSETFFVEIEKNTYGDTIYRCPECRKLSGTAIVANPGISEEYWHTPGCKNKGKYPMGKYPMGEYPMGEYPRKLNARDAALAMLAARYK